MNPTTQFDADAYWKAGNCPWTFFAFPRVLADDAGLPPDDDAKRLLAALQRRGIPVGTWANNTFVADTAYFACPKEAIEALNEAISALEPTMPKPSFVSAEALSLSPTESLVIDACEHLHADQPPELVAGYCPRGCPVRDCNSWCQKAAGHDSRGDGVHLCAHGHQWT